MAFSLSGIMTLNNAPFMRGIRQSQSASNSMSGTAGRTAGAIGGIAIAGAGVLGLGIGIKKVTSTFIGFEKEMSNVKAITEETSSVQMKKLNDKAMEMGRLLPASATDAAKAMSALGSAGFTTDEILKSVEGTLYLAASAQTDMATAADITSGTLRGFGLEASKSGHVADVLSTTSAKTNASIIDLGEGMKYAAPVMKAMGISLEETSAAMGILANANIKGSTAGTTLRSAMVRLTKPMKPAKEAMDAMGFSAYDTQGKMKPLSKIIGELQTKTKGYTQEQKNAAIAQIFGQEALSGMLVLMDAGPEKIDSLTDSLKKSDGAAEKMAKTQTDNLWGALESVKGAAETAGLKLMGMISPELTSFMNSLADSIPKISSFLVDLGSKFESASTGSTGLKTSLGELGVSLNDFGTNALSPFLSASMPLFIVTWDNVTKKINTVIERLTYFSDFLTGVFTLDFGKSLKAIEGMFGSFYDNTIGKLKTLGSFFSKVPSVLKDLGGGDNKSKGAKNANGTSYFGGGASLVNERGGEMQVLRNGTSVIPADRTRQMIEGNAGGGETTHIWNIDARGMNVDELVTTLKLRLANV